MRSVKAAERQKEIRELQALIRVHERLPSVMQDEACIKQLKRRLQRRLKTNAEIEIAPGP